MKNKLLSVITIVLALMLTLTSCDAIFGTTTPPGSDSTGGDEQKPDDKKNVTLNKLVYTDAEIDFSEIRLEMLDILNSGVTVNHISNATESAGEIVFGDSTRAVTTAAKAALSAELDSSSKNDIGYIIYFDGSSVAVYWQHPEMQSIAVADFLNVCVKEQKLKLEVGKICSTLYNAREFETDKYWLALEKVADPSVVSALKTLNAYYDAENIIDWMANLYDPAIDGDDSKGGFYYSISARDNEPYRPDIESTSQILSLLVSSGAFKDRNELPTQIKAQILNFVLNTQSKNDGYFYHPQWPQDKNKLNTDRYGRDLSRATGIISYLDIDIDGDGIEDDIYPYYCAPNGNKCENHKDGGSCSFPISTASYISSNINGSVTSALGSSVGAAVSGVSSSYVSATAVSSHPNYDTRETFKAWLYEYNASIKENSGKAHNLSAISSEIRAHGYTDIVVEQIMTAQREVYEEQVKAGIEPTGLWQRTADYNAVWGILKYASYFNSAEWTIPMSMEYITCMVKTCIKVIAMPADGDYEANDIFNMWNAVDRILTHVNRHYSYDEKLVVYELLRDNAGDLVRNSIDKLQPFKREDGSFSYKSNGHSLATIYGADISLGAVEGDVNAVALCCQMYEGIFTALGYTEVPLFTAADGERFNETILNSEPIEKVKLEVGVVDFESGDAPKIFSPTLKSTGAKADVEPDPNDSTNNAYHFVSNVITGSGSDSVVVSTTNLGASCYVFDVDMYVSSEGTDTGYVMQLYLDNAYIIAINNDGKKVTIKDDQDGQGKTGMHTFGSVELDQWFRLTCEVYVPDEENDELNTAKIRMWINGEYCGESEYFYDNGNGVFVDGYDSVKFYSMKKKATDIYIDNCYFASENRDYNVDDTKFNEVREY